MKGPRFYVPLSLAIALAVALAASACSGGAAPASPTTAPAKPAATQAAAPAGGVPALTKQYQLSMATGGTAGTYYPYGGAIASLLSNNIKGLTVTAQTTGASVENLRLMGSKQVEMAISQNDIADYAMNGTEFFKDNKITNIRGMAVLYPEYIQIAVPADSNIKSYADLKGKRVSVGPPGSGSEANTRELVDAAGMTYKDFANAAQLSDAEAAAAFKNHQIDAMEVTTGVPASAFQDIGTAMKIRVLPVDGDLAKNLMSKYKFFVPVTIPANTYNGQDQPVQSVAVLSTLLVREDLDTDLVYAMTKTLFDKQPELAQAHAKGKLLTLQSAVTGLTVPWHPGAEKYYKEIGALK